MRLSRAANFLCLLLTVAAAPRSLAAVAPDLSGYAADCRVRVSALDETIKAEWQGGAGRCEMLFDLREGRPLIQAVRIADGEGRAARDIVGNVDPWLSLTVGARTAPAGRPPQMSIWNVFFDNPAKKPHETHVGKFELQSATVTGTGMRASVAFGGLTAGAFAGEWVFTFFDSSPLVKVEAVVSTREDARAFIFDLGLAGSNAGWRRVSWVDTEDRPQSVAIDGNLRDEKLAVRRRMIAADGASGSLAVFPPPHQFFFPVDYTSNNRFAWRGHGHQGEKRFGLGLRQDPTGGGNFVPWFNAPPGSRQRIGMFLLLSAGDSATVLDAAGKYTREDRFPPLPGHTTFTSHYHMAMAVTAMDQAKSGIDPLPVPEFVRMFKDMGVQAVHLAEFHGDGHPRDPGPLRLPEMKAMFSECARLSDDKLLLMPGEEANAHLGIPFPGRHPGHWMLLFPRPVYWTMVREEGQPLSEEIPDYGTVHHVGSRDDMVKLIKEQNGLAWTAHARIKASSWTPDIFRHEDFYLDDLWLGAAWKNMPADLSRDRLGERCLDLLSDMANWGQKKYLPGEVDVFKLDHTHELYGHMNINYLRLEKPPRYADGWQPVLDTLRAGAFFTTTGEILIKSFTVAGKPSGESVQLPADGKPEVRVDLEWTFPLQFAEVISGDGEKVFREPIDLSHDTGSFGSRTLSLKPGLAGRKWVRFEVWDAATNGAYTQPVWLQ